MDHVWHNQQPPYIIKYNGYCWVPIFCTARNKKPGSGQEMRLHLCIMHIQLFTCTILVFVFCYYTSIGHCGCCGKRMIVVILKPLSLWESVLNLIITMTWTHVCLYVAQQYLQVDGPKTSPSLTLTVGHILFKYFILIVLGELLPCAHWHLHTCTRLCINLYGCIYNYDCAQQWKRVMLGEKLISCYSGLLRNFIFPNKCNQL